MNTAIVYYSKHHGNTKKLVDAIAREYDVTAIDVAQNPCPDLTGYTLIGLASGIYYSKFHKSLLNIAETLPRGKKVFLLYTYGAKKDTYTRAIREAAAKSYARVVGEYGCFGFDTFGPFRLIGGMAKGHPNQDELRGAVSFFEGIPKLPK
ncbi:MAG: flavodoxin family protein [Clostridiales bacterium]|nr:flavodoxin family protein [Clostridiales bacterium]MDO4350658.1 flavodoxin family protein [Eubacteriales bacterium]MDY4009355.1 flavodoxin family protein [Candidatus Limiplasma sp.]